MKKLLRITLLAFIMFSMDLSASILGKLGKGGTIHGVSSYMQSCTGGDMDACKELGKNYKYARGVEQSDSE